MSVYKLVEETSLLEPKDAFAKLKGERGFSTYSKSKAPYFLQPEGRIYTLYSHDFYFKNGDCITYTAKVGEPAAINGFWDCYDSKKEAWYRYKNEEFIIHEIHSKKRRHKPDQHL